MLFIYVEFLVWLCVCECVRHNNGKNNSQWQWHDECDGNGDGSGRSSSDGGGCQTKSAMSMIKCKRDEIINQLSRVFERYGNVTICEWITNSIFHSFALFWFLFVCFARLPQFFFLCFIFAACIVRHCCVLRYNIGIHGTFTGCAQCAVPVANVFSMNIFLSHPIYSAINSIEKYRFSLSLFFHVSTDGGDDGWPQYLSLALANALMNQLVSIFDFCIAFDDSFDLLCFFLCCPPL